MPVARPLLLWRSGAGCQPDPFPSLLFPCDFHYLEDQVCESYRCSNDCNDQDCCSYIDKNSPPCCDKMSQDTHGKFGNL